MDEMQTIQRQRSLAPDLARGFMLLLIAMAYTDAHLTNWESQALEGTPADIFELSAILVKTMFRDNRAYPMFAFLFGYGSVLLFQRLHQSNLNNQQILVRFRLRAFWLVVFGFFHSVLVFSYEILAPYGMALFLSAPLLFKNNQWLIKTLQFLIPIFVLSLTGIGFLYAVPPETYDIEYNTQANTYPNMILIGLRNFPMSALMVLTYPIVPLMVIGMLAGRISLLMNLRENLPLLRKISVIGVSISMAGAIPLLIKDLRFWEPNYEMEALAIALHLISGTFGGVGYAALFGIVSVNLRNSNGIITTAISSLGKRSLTGYLLASTAIMLLMSSCFGNLGSKLSYFQSAVLGFSVWICLLVFSYMLELKKAPGPLDSLLRTLSNRNRKLSAKNQH